MREKELEKIKEYKYGFSTDIESIRGSSGGYILNTEPEQITLSNIFSAVDEKIKTLQCKRESKKGCNGRLTKCITHNLWDDLEMHINDFFDKKNLGDILKNNLETRI